jgi:small-conductance mechanosensitive channel
MGLETISRWLRVPLLQAGEQTITPAHLLTALAIVLVGYYGARGLRRTLERVLRHLHPAPRYTVMRLAHYGLWLLVLLLVLQTLEIDLTALALAAGVLGVGIGFGLQNIVANSVAGLVLLLERPIKVGDRITVERTEGTVVEINLRSTTVVTNDNIVVIVPNSNFVNQSVINWSYSDRRVRIHVPVGVAYGSDVEKVTRTLLEVAESVVGAVKEQPPEVRFAAFGDSALLFELLAWTDRPEQHLLHKSRLNYAIDAAFRREGIQIPFPQRDVHLLPGHEAPMAAPLPFSATSGSQEPLAPGVVGGGGLGTPPPGGS